MAPPWINFCPRPAACSRHFGTDLTSGIWLQYKWPKTPSSSIKDRHIRRSYIKISSLPAAAFRQLFRACVLLWQAHRHSVSHTCACDKFCCQERREMRGGTEGQKEREGEQKRKRERRVCHGVTLCARVRENDRGRNRKRDSPVWTYTPMHTVTNTVIRLHLWQVCI